MRFIQNSLSLFFTLSSCLGFSPNKTYMYPTPPTTSLQLSQQPPDWGSFTYGNDAMQNQQQPEPEANNENGGEESLKGNRWSQFAPDTNLPTNEFRAQLKENMKADLERRRREDPNRGNQPAKSYLDSL